MTEFKLIDSTRHDVYPFISTNDGLANASNGRSVLVIGAGTGIGRQVAIAFAESGAANVILSSRREVNINEVKQVIQDKCPKTNVLAIAADAAQADQVDVMFSQIKEAGITLDVLVNSQGARKSRARIADSEPDEWWDDLESYLKSPYLTTRAFLRSLKKPDTLPKEPNKAIINITSIAANALLPLGNVYSLAKVGLNRFTEYTAAEGEAYGVQSIAVHPGGVANTDTTKHSPAFMIPYYTETVELAAGAVVYCSTPRAAYLSGRYVDVTWDFEELEKQKERIVKEDLLKTSILGETRLLVSAEVRKQHFS